MREYAREEMLWLWLHAAAGYNVSLFEQVCAVFPDLEEAYALAAGGQASAFSRWGAPFFSRLREAAAEQALTDRLDWMRKNGVYMVCGCSEGYPALLKEISHPPPLLYVKGRLEANPRLPVAIVGMRKSTAYGEGVAAHLAGELVKSGATVVSGLALGIDSRAAEGALAVEQGAEHPPTIAVLGCGVDVIYPSSSARLYYEIVERGAVISEFPPGTKPFRENFPIRNRVISGLSRGVVVVEAAARSGSIITANYALEQNRDVFAVPGRITDEASFGPNGMIQRGEAKPVFCAADILSEYGMHPALSRPQPEVDTSGLSELERAIVEELKRGERNADELCEKLSLSAAQINSCLTSLQFSGIIKQLPGRVFGL